VAHGRVRDPDAVGRAAEVDPLFVVRVGRQWLAAGRFRRFGQLVDPADPAVTAAVRGLDRRLVGPVVTNDLAGDLDPARQGWTR
jgi:hypothetical protein